MSDTEIFDVIIVGAGLSGIGAACHLEQLCPGKRYAILEGREALGGTWDLFRYPGIRSDSDMHTMGYAFKPWTASKAIAEGPAILDYLKETAAEFGIERHIRFQHQVTAARWDSDYSAWTVEVRRADTGETVKLRANFLLMCVGYFRYEHGHQPEFPGRERFGGPVIDPQRWPEDLDYAGKRVVVIGSGATAVTLLPSMADTAAHVTMLQRSPTYLISMPGDDPIAKILKKLLPEKWAYALTRKKNILLQQWIYRQTRTRPERVRRVLLRRVRKELGPEYDIETNFTPAYDPWDQRLCLVPDSDFFDAIRSGKTSVVTDRIDTFTETGILLESGKHLDADIIVAATGLELHVLADVHFDVDGEPVNFAETFTYQGVMNAGVPNMISTFGYINASWTLRSDLIARYACRIINHMDDNGYRQCTPMLRAEDRAMPKRPWISGFSPGYLRRVLPDLPKQGDREPWINAQDYAIEKKRFLDEPLEDGVLTFSKRVRDAA